MQYLTDTAWPAMFYKQLLQNITAISKSKTILKFYDWFKSYGDVTWGVGKAMDFLMELS